MKSPLDQRPLIVVLAGSNGAGKTTFYYTHLATAGLRFINADILARELHLTDAYAAARAADLLRRSLVEQRESFVFETVFSDPVGDKLAFLEDARTQGYQVVLCFIGIADPATSKQRVAMRVTQGGHDVPDQKLEERFPRTQANLRQALLRLPHVWIFDNEDLRSSFRKVAVFEHGEALHLATPQPRWLRALLPAKTQRRKKGTP